MQNNRKNQNQQTFDWKIPESFLEKRIESTLIVQNEFRIPPELWNIFTATPYSIQMLIHDRKAKVLCV